MITLWTRRLWPYVAVVGALVALWLAIDAWRGRGGGHDRRAAHQATVVAQTYVYVTDTLYRHDTLAFRVAEVRYRTLRDTLRLTDTLAVREGFRLADSALARCDSVLRSSATTIRARDTLIVRVKDELAIADRTPRRLSARAVALYDPLAGIPAASIEGALRLTGRLSLVVRGDQRFTPGERPRGYAGVALTF